MSTSSELRKKAAAEVRKVSVDFSGKLDSGELLTGSPSAVADSGITAGSPSRNSSTIVVNGRSVAVDMAVQFTLSGGTAGTSYNVVVSCGTSGGQTLSHTIQVLVE